MKRMKRMKKFYDKEVETVRLNKELHSEV